MSGTWVFGWIKQFQDGEVSKDPTIWQLQELIKV
jgi:hypothetical protein